MHTHALLGGASVRVVLDKAAAALGMAPLPVRVTRFVSLWSIFGSISRPVFVALFVFALFLDRIGMCFGVVLFFAHLAQ